MDEARKRKNERKRLADLAGLAEKIKEDKALRHYYQGEITRINAAISLNVKKRARLKGTEK